MQTQERADCACSVFPFIKKKKKKKNFEEIEGEDNKKMFLPSMNHESLFQEDLLLYTKATKSVLKKHSWYFFFHYGKTSTSPLSGPQTKATP